MVVNKNQNSPSRLSFERTEKQAVAKRRNAFMLGGNKSTVEKIREDCSVYLRTEGMLTHQNRNFDSLVKKVRDELKPVVETISVKRAGSIYQVPHPVAERRGYSLAARWLVIASRKRANGGLRLSEARGQELCSVLVDVNNTSEEVASSEALKQRITVHKTAKSNRVFSHLRQR